MHTLLGFFGVLTRLLRPTQGTHTTAFGYLRELGFEARRNRSRRVRRYVKALTPPELTELTEPKPLEPAPLAPVAPVAPARRTPVASAPLALVPLVPAPRRPIEDECPKVAIVRGPYRAWEAHRAELRELAA